MSNNAINIHNAHFKVLVGWQVGVCENSVILKEATPCCLSSPCSNLPENRILVPNFYNFWLLWVNNDGLKTCFDNLDT